MARRDDGEVDREPVAEVLPDGLQAQLETMRSLARPYLDGILAELRASPTTLLRDLPAFRYAASTEDDELRLALVVATLERRLDSDDPIWHTLWVAFMRHAAGDEDAARIGDDPVLSALQQAWAARWEEQREELLAAGPPQPRQVPTLPPHLDERLLGHRGAAEPWLARIEAMEAGRRAVQEAFLSALQRGEQADHEQLATGAAVEDFKDIVRELKGERAELQVSVALASLYESVADLPRAGHSRHALWTELNRRALPYEADDLELALRLLEGHQYNWYFGERLVRAVSRHHAAGDEIPPVWQDALRDMLAFAAGSRLATYQKMAVTIRSLLGTGGAATATRLDLSSLDADDAWTSTVRARLAEEHGDDGGLNPLLVLLQDSGTGPRPGAAWRRRLAPALDASEAADDVLRMLLGTAVEVRDELVRRTDSGDWLYSTLGEPAALKIRAAAWAAQLSGTGWAPDLLEQLAARYAELLFEGQPHSARVANGAVSALALASNRDSVVRLARLQRSMWHGSMLKHLERELDSLAEAADLTRSQLLELSAPDLGLGADGTCTLPIGETGSLRLELEERCRLVAGWSTGEGATKSSPPPALRAAEPERVRELELLVKQHRASLAAERSRMDGLLAEQPRWHMAEWRASYVEHPVLRTFGRTLVWNVDVGHAILTGTPGDEGDGFLAVDGATFTAPADAVVTVWHPVAAPDEETAAWRSALFARRLVQPVRQVFREVYRVSPDERGARHYTNRFAGHLLQHRPLRGLFKRRGWKSPALLTWTEEAHDVAVASRLFHGFGIRAELRYSSVWTKEVLDGIPGSYQLVSTDQLRFRPAGRKDADELALEDVPAIVFCEAMRDVDLFVSTCSVALDPAWQDAGDEALQVQWRELAFGELVESARVRRDVLGHALPELSIADRCAVYDRDLVVTGTRATYRINIGTGQVRVDPDGKPLVLPERRRSDARLARLFLPVEADDTLLAVLATAFLLANDDAITDPSVRSQLPG